MATFLHTRNREERRKWKGGKTVAFSQEGREKSHWKKTPKSQNWFLLFPVFHREATTAHPKPEQGNHKLRRECFQTSERIGLYLALAITSVNSSFHTNRQKQFKHRNCQQVPSIWNLAAQLQLGGGGQNTLAGGAGEALLATLGVGLGRRPPTSSLLSLRRPEQSHSP